jgi:hypothetical protein
VKKRSPAESRAAKRYGSKHAAVRRDFRRLVADGTFCARCRKPIEEGAAWELDHDDHEERLYVGPSHRSCNRAAANEIKTSRKW